MTKNIKERRKRRNKNTKTPLLLIPMFILIVLNFFYFSNIDKIKKIVTSNNKLKFFFSDEEEIVKTPEKSVQDNDFKIRYAGNSNYQESVDQKIISKKQLKEKDSNLKTISQKSDEKEVQVNQNNIYFLYIDKDNKLKLKTEKVYVKGKNQLENTLKKLIAKRDISFYNLIPKNTKLLKTSIENGIAILDFSNDIKYNENGYESTFLSLKQIVYTAMQFNNVKGVKFLIEGKSENFINEGVSIKNIFTKKSFY